jgi:hypothetical protein
MPNSIKYSTTGDTLSLRKGNFYIGTGDVGKGPTSSSGHWNGITPPSGGYSVYKNKVSNGPAIWTAASDNQLVLLTNNIEGTSFTTAQQCLNYYATQTDKMVLNEDYEGIITNGLVLNLDAGFTPSYQGSGTTWYDLSYSGNNGTLTNGPTYSSLDGGYISFDGTNDTVNIGPASKYLNAYHTYEVWIKTSSIGANTQSGILGISYGLTINILNDGRINYLVYRNETNSYIINAATTGINVLDNKWHHIVCTRGPSTYEIYVDGALNRTGSNGGEWTGTNIWASMDAQIGNNPNNISLLYLGNIGIVRIYNRYTLSTEVLQNYNAGLVRFNTPNIVKTNLLLNLDSTNSVSYPTTGTVWRDLSGYGNTGTLTNGPTFDVTSKSIVFDGTDDYVTVSPSNQLNTLTQFTYIACLNISSSDTYGAIISRNTSLVWYAGRTTVKQRLFIGGSATGDSNTFLPSDRFTFISVTWDGSTVRYYFNGLPDGTATNNLSAFNNTPITIGRYQTGEYFQGNISDAAIYNRALSPTEILQNYYGGPIVTSGLIMALDASNIVSYPGSGTTWYDLSGNGNHATLYNSPTYNSQGWFSFDGIDDYARTTNTLNLSTTDKVTVLVIFKPNSYSGGVKLVYEHTANFNNSTGGFLQAYNDNSLAQDNQVFVSNRGNAGYNIGVWDKSLFNDLTWKFSNCVFDRSQPLVENLFYLQGSITTAIQNPYPGYTANNTNNYANDYFYIGCRGGSGIFADMNVSAVFIYNRVLTDSEIAQNFNAYKSRFGL